jgi:hypothetical protein
MSKLSGRVVNFTFSRGWALIAGFEFFFDNVQPRLSALLGASFGGGSLA